jgi:putative photosynthetic complex assembly protein 2
MPSFSLLLPVLYAVFLWWFTTGVIMVVYDRSRPVLRWYFAVATVAMVAALIGLTVTARSTDPTAVYVSVTCGVVIWGWQVTGYYLGFVTGPEQAQRESEDVSGANDFSLLDRFRLALSNSIHHEMMVLVFGLIMLALTWGRPNQWGLWMYLALWVMHSSAKLNVFFGVRNFRIEFLPRRMHHLDALLMKRDHNEFFPFSITIASSVVLMLVYRSIMPSADPAQSVGHLLIATMMTLGVIEHWLLVLPVPAGLWGWGVRTLPESQSQSNVVVRNTSRQDVAKQKVKGEL